MFGYINQYSYILVSGVVITTSFLLLYRIFSLKIAILSFLMILLVAGFSRSLFTTSSYQLSGIDDWKSLHNAESPVLLYLYSDL